jgi:hypothetical protein
MVRHSGRCRTWFAAGALLVRVLQLVARVTPVGAQERPSARYQTDQFNESVSFRQNVCDLQDKYDRRETTLETALEGLELHTVHAISQYFQLKDGAIDEEYPGLTAVILDELASRAKFTWRNSYATTGPPVAGKTWTELLQWTTGTYDLSVDWWAQSIDRLGMGISYTEGWYDASIIMVAPKNTNESKFDAWSWLDPFATGVWIMICVLIVFSGLVYWLLESINHKSDKRSLENSPIENIFLAGIVFTSHFEFRPRTHAARLFTLSLAFWALITGAAYTANLASFLVAANLPHQEIKSVNDAVQRQLNICVFESTQADEALTNEYPNAKIIRKKLEDEVYLGIVSGECGIAVVTMSSWEYFERDAEVNGGCHLNWVGRTFRFVSAGFATVSDSGALCTSLIRDVLNLHLMRMKEEDVLDEAWDNHLKRTETIDCVSRKKNDVIDTHSGQLDLSNMGGIFLFHIVLSVAALLAALIGKGYRWKKKRDAKLKAALPLGGMIEVSQLSRDGTGNNDEWSEKESFTKGKNAEPLAQMVKEIDQLAKDHGNQAAVIEEMNAKIATIMNLLSESNTCI